ncbi:hypothetical protein AmaxDRAFT_3181 [Limnospira maxima CS-328]|uniref:Uncharacterized protein n=2 Tax=Limnospira TaxID=2596745 RepID=B5W333_LIMMA|nr:hypothetical protein [Limnospira maxima]EDZ94113.1 hypothetical protein AmaxDRAFT_3181 [Limnospira maxima CS-328]
MREVEERSRRARDIVRNRNYRQAIDVIEREVKRLEADDKPRARVRFPRDDGDIEIDVGGIVEFAQAMKPKISAEAEDLQDGRTRRGIKAEKIGSTAHGFVDLDEDGNPKGFGGTIDSINDANVSVYLGECEQTMSVTMFGKTVTFARNVCEDDRDEEGDDNRRGDDDTGASTSIGNLSVPGPPLGFKGQLCTVYLRYIVEMGTGGTLYSEKSMLDSAASSTNSSQGAYFITGSPYGHPSKDIFITPLGETTTGGLRAMIASLREGKNLPPVGGLVHRYITVESIGIIKADAVPKIYHQWMLRYPSGSTRVEEYYMPVLVGVRDKETGKYIFGYLHAYWLTRHSYYLGFYSSNHPVYPCRYVRNYQPEPPPSLPILRDDMNKECCDDLIKMTREIHKALGVRKLLDKSFQIPANMMIPEGRGNHINKDYLEIMSDLFKTIDNYGFDAPVTVTVQDTNKAQEGDQSIELKFNSLGAILKAQTELLIELKGDSANRLNIQIRLAYIMTRMYRTLAKLYYRTSAILDGLGIPIISKVVTLPIEFNVFGKKHWGAGKGFGKDNKKGQEPKLDLNDEDTTEAMLPDLLEIHDYEIEVDEFRAKSNDLYEVLIGIAAKLRS